MAKPITSLLFLGFLLISSCALQAQWLVGGGIVLGSTDEGKAGINLKTSFPIKGRLFLSPNVTLFASERDISRAADTKVRFTTINLDGQVHFEVVDALILYPLLGVQIAISRVEIEDSAGGFDRNVGSDVGINIGGGGRYQILDRLSVFTEAGYTLAGIEQVGITLGVLFHLAESNRY